MLNTPDGFQHARRLDTFHPGGVHQMEFVTPYRARVVIEGPQPQVFDAVHRYYREWPPAGYGTHQVEWAMGTGTARYVLERSTSCD